MLKLNKLKQKALIFLFRRSINEIIKDQLTNELKKAKPYIRDSYYYKRLKSIKTFNIKIKED